MATKQKSSASKEVTKKDSKKTSTASKAVSKKALGKVSSMDELLAKTGYSLQVPKRGDVIKGLVTEVHKKLVLVDIGAKTEGLVIDKEAEAASELIKTLKPGDEIEVFVKNPENDQGQILLSLRQAADDKRWEVFQEWLSTGKPVEVKGIETNKGGLIVLVDGMRGFVPASQFSQEFLGRMEKLVEKTFKAQVIEVDREQNRLIFSEKIVSEAGEIAKKDQALKQVKVNDVLEGTVSGIMPFGVFVTIKIDIGQGDEDSEQGKLEGLIHISEISWEKVEDPNKHYKVGDKVEVQVIGIEEDTGKLNLSVKRLFNDPWKEIEKKYAEGTQHKGEVVRLAPYGIFVNFEPGIDGLIHISKIPAGKEFKVGEEVNVYVEMLDKDSRRISLGVVLTEVPVGYK